MGGLSVRLRYQQRGKCRGLSLNRCGSGQFGRDSGPLRWSNRKSYVKANQKKMKKLVRLDVQGFRARSDPDNEENVSSSSSSIICLINVMYKNLSRVSCWVWCDESCVGVCVALV